MARVPRRTPPPNAAPDGARVVHFRVGDAVYAVFSYDTTSRAPSALSPAELAVVGHALEGLSNQSIALERGTSVRTVRNQLASAYEKLGVRSRSELAAWAARHLPP